MQGSPSLERTSSILRRFSRFATLLGCVLACVACSTDPPAPCSDGQSRCVGQVAQLCTEGEWQDDADCARQGGTCYVTGGEASCLGGSPGVDAGVSSVDGGTSGNTGTLPLPHQVEYEPCPAQQAWHPLEARCIGCAASACDGEGEDGVFEGTTLDGKCICRTQEGFYWPESGLMAVECDKDGDGWVSVEARSSLASVDRAYLENARCSLRLVDGVVLEAEGARVGEGRRVSLSEIDEDLQWLPLYEVESLDDQARLALDDKIKQYGARKPPASALNSLTKACVDSIADFNGNDVPDVEEWDQYSEDVALWRSFPELRVYTQFSYFLELHSGSFEVTDDSNPREIRGRYHVRERSRRGDGASIPMEVAEPAEDASKVYSTEGYWRSCERRTDSAFDPGAPTVGMDFARFNAHGAVLGSRVGSGNLLAGAGAEDRELLDWERLDGPFESVVGGACGGPVPHGGERFFALGGLCEPGVDSARARQTIDLRSYLPEDTEGLEVAFGGWLRTFSGDDVPSINIVYRDVDDNELDPVSFADGEMSADPRVLSTRATEWTLVSGTDLLPPGTVRVDFVLSAQRNAGTDNDSYFDDLYLGLLSTKSNVLDNPGAEDETTSWPEPMQAVSQTECGSSLAARSGYHFFQLGDCDDEEATELEAYQDYDLEALAEQVDTGGLSAVFSLWAHTDGSSTARVSLRFLGDEDSRSVRLVSSERGVWEPLTGRAPVPPGTRTIRFHVQAQNDDGGAVAFFDDLNLRVATGANMFHHSQFKCVQIVDENPDPARRPHQVTEEDVQETLQVNDCGVADADAPVLPTDSEIANPKDLDVQCTLADGVPQRGKVTWGVVDYLHYPLRDRPEYVRGCENACRSQSPDCRGDNDDGRYACKADREVFGATTCSCAFGLDPRSGCTDCQQDGNWDPDRDCAVCRGNWDPLEECEQCKGNWDVEDECRTCRNSWTDVVGSDGESNECGLCPDDDELGHWDPEQDCGACRGHWGLDDGCLSCEGNRDERSDCEECLPNFDFLDDCNSCLGNWDIDDNCQSCRANFDPQTGCGQCLPNFERVTTADGTSYCVACSGNWDPEPSGSAGACTACLPGWDEATLCTSCVEGFELYPSHDVPAAERTCIRSNLLANGDIEDVDAEERNAASSWDGDTFGYFAGHCAAATLPSEAAEGVRFLNVGGVCGADPVAPDCVAERTICGTFFGIRACSLFRFTTCTDYRDRFWGSQNVVLEDLYADISDPDQEVYVRLFGYARATGGQTPLLQLGGMRPDGESEVVSFPACGLSSGSGACGHAVTTIDASEPAWQPFSTRPLRLPRFTYQLLVSLGALRGTSEATPAGANVFYDALQLRACFKEEDCCIYDPIAGQSDCCVYQGTNDWSCGG